MERMTYQGWDNCYRLQNDQVELIVTGAVGPRIIHFSLRGGENEFHVFPDDRGQTGGEKWRPYGGHRLWHAPEAPQRTYVPDNTPVDVKAHAAGLRAVQPIEPLTGVRKILEVRLIDRDGGAVVTHRLENAGAAALQLAPWALSVMAPGGVGMFPLPPAGEHPRDLLPRASLVLWPYTDLTDPRWRIGRDGVLLRQDVQARRPQKIGLHSDVGWLAYVRGGRAFVKRAARLSNATYPDFGAALEMFTNSDMLEVETLGPFVTLEPGEAVAHVEQWFLLQNVPGIDDPELFQHLAARVAALPPMS